MDSTNINLTSYFSNLERVWGKKVVFRGIFFLWKCDCNSTCEFSKLKSHNKALYTNVVSPEVQPTSKACLRQKISSKHRKYKWSPEGSHYLEWELKEISHILMAKCLFHKVNYTVALEWLTALGKYRTIHDRKREKTLRNIPSELMQEW